MPFYKVVAGNLDTQEFYSVVIEDPPLKTRYFLNEWTRPNVPDAPLMVFDRRIAAISLAISQVDCMSCGLKPYVFTCEVENPRPTLYMPRYFSIINTLEYDPPPPGLSATEYIVQEVQEVWRKILTLSQSEKLPKVPNIDSAYRHSFVCDAVKLTSLAYSLD